MCVLSSRRHYTCFLKLLLVQKAINQRMERSRLCLGLLEEAAVSDMLFSAAMLTKTDQEYSDLSIYVGLSIYVCLIADFRRCNRLERPGYQLPPGVA